MLYVLGASNLIPDILNARFFIILCGMILLCMNDKDNEDIIEKT